MANDTISIVLEVFDDEGNVVDSTPADLSADAVQDIVAQAVAVCRAAENVGIDLSLHSAIMEMREALESYSLIDPEE